MSKLFELSNAYLQIFESVDDEEQDLDTLEATLQAVEGAIEVKAEGMVKLIKMLDYDAEAIKQEETRLRKRRQAREARVSRIKQYLQEQMELMGKDKIQTPLLTIAIQKNPPSVDDFAPNLIPAKYQKVEYSLDKQAILRDLKNNIEVPGACLKQSSSIRIR